ncbi:uncharacterized protein LOC134677565 [Cydia fagiglandana]|uniref:uncharacterized protein LOC134677565 n=1 Tax=Cydia fagiglandana TaxID=1458189 RepID=UPI002FEE285F
MFKLNGSNTYYIVLPVVQNTCSDQDLLCCRACLSTDGGLYNIHEYKLADAFSAIAGTSIIRDQLPQYLCSHCRTLLMKFASFRNMCTRTQQQLLLGLQTGQLNTNYIHSIYQPSHRFFNLTITEVETIDCILEDETDPENYIKIMETLTQDINLETPIAEDIKDEPNIDIIDINNILNNTDEMIEFDTEIDEESNHIGNNIVPIKDRTGTKSKIESVNGHVIEMDGGIINENEDKSCQSVSQGNELNVGFGDDHIENMNDASSIQNKKNPVKKRKRNVSSVQNPNNTVKKLNGNKKEKKKTECKLKEKIASRKLVRGRKRIKKENEKMRRNEIFESNYSVKIVFLSKEEQLAELAARQKTNNYSGTWIIAISRDRPVFVN